MPGRPGMEISRNDPCPCGSGRKYKHCCMWKDHARQGQAGSLHSAVFQEEIRKVVDWQADVLPLPASIEAEPQGRPVLVLVTADGYALHHDTLSSLPGDAARVAATLAGAVQQITGRLGAGPERLWVRHDGVARELADRLPEIAVSTTNELDQVDQVYSKMMKQFGLDTAPVGSIHPLSWKGWQVKETLIRDLFQGAAHFWEAGPWLLFDVDEPLTIVFPEGHIRYAQVLGLHGIEEGLALYDGLEDIVLQLENLDQNEMQVSCLKGEMVTMLYNHADRIPPSTRREIHQAGWPIAGREAYPFLVALRTPAAGVRDDLISDLARALVSVSRFAEAVETGQVDIAADDENAWVDPENGLSLSHGWLVPQAGPDDPGFYALSVDASQIHTTCPEGPGARPEEVLESIPDPEDLRADLDLIHKRFVTHLQAQGLGEQTVTAHRNSIEALTCFLADSQGVPLCAFREYDLRIFLYDWYPRKWGTSETQAMRLPVGLKRFFRFLEDEDGIRYPWAEDLLTDRESFGKRWYETPGSFFWSEGVDLWRSETYAMMDELVMLPDKDLGPDDEWGDRMGIEEYQLITELQNTWLIWRDELIREGTIEPDELRSALIERQRKWESAGRPHRKGRTPLQIILEERESRAHLGPPPEQIP